MRIGHRDDHRLLGEIEVADGVEGVEVGAHDDAIIGRRIRRHIGDRVHWAVAEAAAGGSVGELPARYVHGDEGVEIDVGIDADRVRFLLGDCVGPRRQGGTGCEAHGSDGGGDGVRL